MPRLLFIATPKLPRDLAHLAYKKGDVVDLPPDQCERWINRGVAAYAPAPTAAPPDAETSAPESSPAPEPAAAVPQAPAQPPPSRGATAIPRRSGRSPAASDT